MSRSYTVAQIPTTSETPWCDVVGHSHAQDLLGNQAFAGQEPVAAVARGAELLRSIGFAGAPQIGDMPLSCMRTLLLQSRAAVEGISIDTAMDSVYRSSGHPLPDDVRVRLEAAFNHDFSHVRIHTDGAAGDATSDVHALAFALGSHVFFAPGRFDPASAGGRELLAHELTHVVQHDEHRLPGRCGQADVSSPHDAHEREAASLAREILGMDIWDIDTHAALQRFEGDMSSVDAPAPAEESTPSATHAAGDLLREDDAGEALTTTPSVAPTDFAQQFSREFWPILHIFREHTTIEGGAGQQISQAMDDITPISDVMAARFTSEQQQKLLGFINSSPHIIPERLFNGDNPGGCSTEQRILVSAHILSQGFYMVNGMLQRVHAENCGEWARMLINYAAAAPTAPNDRAQVRRTFDIFGNVILGTIPNDPGLSGQQAPADAVCRAGADGEVATPVNTAHNDRQHRSTERPTTATQNARSGRRRSPPPQVSRRPNLNYDAAIRDIRAGDWLVIYNANGSEYGTHSVIFSRWQTNDAGSPIRHRVAEVFSQNTVSRGARPHTVNISESYYKKYENGTVIREPHQTPDEGPASHGPVSFAAYPVISITHMAVNAMMMSTPDQLGTLLVPARGAANRNDTYLQRNFPEVSPEKLTVWLRERSLTLLAALGRRITLSQHQGFRTLATDPATPREQLVAICQRLEFYQEVGAAIAETVDAEVVQTTSPDQAESQESAQEDATGQVEQAAPVAESPVASRKRRRREARSAAIAERERQRAEDVVSRVRGAFHLGNTPIGEGGNPLPVGSRIEAEVTYIEANNNVAVLDAARMLRRRRPTSTPLPQMVDGLPELGDINSARRYYRDIYESLSSHMSHFTYQIAQRAVPTEHGVSSNGTGIVAELPSETIGLLSELTDVPWACLGPAPAASCEANGTSEDAQTDAESQTSSENTTEPGSEATMPTQLQTSPNVDEISAPES